MNPPQTGKTADYTPPGPRTQGAPRPRLDPVLLAELPPATYPAAVVIGTALEGLPGYDGATRRDLKSLPPMPGGWRIVRDPANPEQAARDLLAVAAPDHTLARDAAGSLRVTPSPNEPRLRGDNEAADDES